MPVCDSDEMLIQLFQGGVGRNCNTRVMECWKGSSYLAVI
jgi:hypothetical protein